MFFYVQVHSTPQISAKSFLKIDFRNLMYTKKYLYEYRQCDRMKPASNSIHVRGFHETKVLNNQHKAVSSHQHTIDTHDDQSDQEQQKVAQITSSDTIVGPDTVMVKSMDTSIAKAWSKSRRFDCKC